MKCRGYQLGPRNPADNTVPTVLWRLAQSHIGACIIGCLLSGLCLFMLLSNQRQALGTVPEILTTATWLPWVPLAIVAYVGGMVLKGYRLKSLVKAEVALGAMVATNIIAAGYAANDILPARLGEVIRAGILSQRSGLPFSQSFAVTLIERILDGIAIVTIFGLAGLFYPTAGWLMVAHSSACLMLLISFACLLLFVHNRKLVVRLTAFASGWMPAKSQDIILRWADEIDRALQFLRNVRKLVRLMVLSIASWLCEALFFMLMMGCFLPSPNFLKAAIIMSGTNLGIMIPSAPGHIGTYHFYVASLFTGLFSTAMQSTALGYAVMVHLVFYLTTLIWGLYVLLLYGIKDTATSVLAWQSEPIEGLLDRTSEPAAVSPSSIELTPASIFWQQLSEAFFPDDVVALNEDDRKKVKHQISSSVFVMLSNLPSNLWILLTAGLLWFRIAAMLTTMRSFESLPLNRRSQLVNEWAFGSIRLYRLLFRPIRSLVLFAYFDNKIVLAAMSKPANQQESDIVQSEVAG